ncbi:Crp/Fnr family transcriptional regulator [Insolitispirillum peregrinum]|uniref:Transcriptional regulator, Crp/Fnr family n=1 Tax=Insolitispirillum peregrinum TaxID=80876 RepID=A0A1N7KE56_9PROT|nr:cyclic nucleotide-binding domain-containing protein [Insolitispirillum peregrinum]SIS59857.1 transcriptional regulator, Crp/Fnr family [Insolitispirillum peregrinum]
MNGPDPLLKLVADSGPLCRCCDLEDSAFCAGLSPEGLRRLRSIRGNLTCEAQETVFREGDNAENIYSVVEGCIKLSKLLSDGRRQVIGFLFPGDFFGFSPSGAYGYTAEAISPSTLCRFSEQRMKALLATTPELEQRLRTRLVMELAFAQEQMLLLGRMSAREKISHFLLMLSRRAVARQDPPSPIAVPMSRLDMADYLGLTIETVSRTLTTMKKDGLIALPSPGIVDLLDRDGLHRIADGRDGG